MRRKTTNQLAPVIWVAFDNDCCTWASTGWGGNALLMAKAKKAIREDEDAEQVRVLAKDALDTAREAWYISRIEIGELQWLILALLLSLPARASLRQVVLRFVPGLPPNVGNLRIAFRLGRLGMLLVPRLAVPVATWSGGRGWRHNTRATIASPTILGWNWTRLAVPRADCT